MSNADKPDETTTFSFRAPIEVDEAADDLERAAKRLPECRMSDGKGARKKPTKAATIAAVLLHVQQLPPAQREAILRDGFARYNAHREGIAQPPPSVEAARGISTEPSNGGRPPRSGSKTG